MPSLRTLIPVFANFEIFSSSWFLVSMFSLVTIFLLSLKLLFSLNLEILLFFFYPDLKALEVRFFGVVLGMQFSLNET